MVALRGNRVDKVIKRYIAAPIIFQRLTQQIHLVMVLLCDVFSILCKSIPGNTDL